MNNNGYYSFDQNAIPHSSVAPFQYRQEDFTFTAINAFQVDNSASFEQTPSFTANTAVNGNAYAFNENTLPQPTFNARTYPMSTTYEEMIACQYAFNQITLPQPAVTNPFDFDFNTSAGIPTANTSIIDNQVLERTITELNGPDWTSAAGPNALSGDTTFGRQTSLATSSNLNAPVELDQSDIVGRPLLFETNKHFRMDDSLVCSWQGCSRPAFKTLKLLETHLENIHVNPLVCRHPGCYYNRPFPKKGDLDRHLATVHGVGRLFGALDVTA